MLSSTAAVMDFQDFPGLNQTGEIDPVIKQLMWDHCQLISLFASFTTKEVIKVEDNQSYLLSLRTRSMYSVMYFTDNYGAGFPALNNVTHQDW